LIDHGAALWFQYDWSRVTEDAPRAAGAAPEPHLFESAAASRDWPCLDAMLAGCLTRAALEDAVADVPADFLRPLLPESIDAASPAVVEDSLCRRRAAYVAFLWKRLREPRAFAG
jgi:hypothetical protein